MTKLLVGALTGALVLGAACSDGGGAATAAEPREVASLRIPRQIAGLAVQAEDVRSTLERVDRPYVDSVAVFSLREEELLQATLQIARFNRRARPDDSSFRRSIVSTVGNRQPIELKVGEHIVFATAASSQAVFLWFERDGMFVLSISQEFPFPRTLLRRVIDVDIRL